MRTLRKRIRQVVLASLPATAVGCFSAPPGSDGSTSAASASATGTAGTGTGGGTSSGSSASTGTTGSCFCGCGQPSSVVIPPFDGGWADGGAMDSQTCVSVCSEYLSATWFCSAVEVDGGDWLLSCPPNCTGRRPAGLHSPRLDAPSALGAHFARMAHLEAASVPAFSRLGRELARFGAPSGLGVAASRAARDEIRHARVMAGFARRHGASPPKVSHPKFERRSLEQFAHENAVEGCVRETFGAAVALVQAQRAREPGLREAMSAIAEDELRHAELAWRVDAWLSAKLDRQARARIDDAKRSAAGELALAMDGEVATWLGLPDAQQAEAIRFGLVRDLNLN